MNKYFCNNCKGIRNHNTLFEIKRKGDEEYGAFQWINEYKVIECCGCENISFLNIYGDNSMIRNVGENDYEYYHNEKIYPYYLKKGVELGKLHLVPKGIRNIYVETINSMKIESLILTAGGFRAIIEAICNHLKIKKTNLEERINLLHNKGYLTLSESKRLHSIRFLGNDALHEIEIPKMEQLILLLEIINHLLANLFINDKIIAGKIETIIDDYEEFSKMFQRKITKDMLGNEFFIESLIGKSKRLLSKSNLEKFSLQLLGEIKKNEIKYLKIIDEKNYKIKVISEPEISFFWE